MPEVMLTPNGVELRRRRTKTCPECGSRVEHFRYSLRVTEIGIANLTGDNLDCEETVDADETASFECPECGEDVIPRSIPFDDENEVEIQQPAPTGTSARDMGRIVADSMRIVIEEAENMPIVDETHAFAAPTHRNAERALGTMTLLACMGCKKKHEVTENDRVIKCECGGETRNPGWTGGRRRNREHGDMPF